MAKTSLYHYDQFPNGLIGSVEIIWQSEGSINDRKLWFRLHPSIFQEAWDALKAVIKRLLLFATNEAGRSAQLDYGDALHMRDLRGEVNAFEIMGPLAGNVVRRVLRICKDEVDAKQRVRSYTLPYVG